MTLNSKYSDNYEYANTSNTTSTTTSTYSPTTPTVVASNNNSSNNSSSKKWFPKISLKIPKIVKKQRSRSSLNSQISSNASEDGSGNSTPPVPERDYSIENPNSFTPPTRIHSKNVHSPVTTPVRDYSVENKRNSNNSGICRSRNIIPHDYAKKKEEERNVLLKIDTNIKCQKNYARTSSNKSQLPYETERESEDNEQQNINSNMNYQGQNERQPPEIRKGSHRRINSDSLNPMTRTRSYSTCSTPNSLYDNNENEDYEQEIVNDDEATAIANSCHDTNVNENHQIQRNYNNYCYNDEENSAVTQVQTNVKTKPKSRFIVSRNDKVISRNVRDESNNKRNSNNSRNSSGSTGNSNSKPVPHSSFLNNCLISPPSRTNMAQSNNKLLAAIEAMQNQTCGNMTAREFALAVGISVCSDSESDSDDDQNGYGNDDDSSSICSNISSTISQLTANGKIPTPNEIYNALSFKSHQRRKHSAPALSLDMFIPPTTTSCSSSVSSLSTSYTNKSCSAISPNLSSNPSDARSSFNSSINGSLGRRRDSNTENYCDDNQKNMPSNEINNNSVKMRNVTNKFSNSDLTNSNSIHSVASNSSIQSKINSKYGTMNSISTNGTLYQNYQPVPPSSIKYRGTCNSNESCTTYASNKYSYSSASSMSGSEVSEDNESGNYSPGYQIVMDAENAKNNLTTTFYSLPRVDFDKTHMMSSSPLSSNVINNGIGVYHGNYPGHIKFNNIVNNSNSNSIFNNQHQHRHSPSSVSSTSSTNSALNINPNPNPNFYISNNKTRNNNNNKSQQQIQQTSALTASFNNMKILKSKAQASWSEMDDCRAPNLVTVRHPSMPVLRPKKTTTRYIHENQIKTYTKGRFTITHETYHNRKASTHKFEIEKN